MTDVAETSTGYCTLDPTSNRPLAGFANFCPNALTDEPDAFQAQLETAVHEALHALAFSSTLFSQFIGKDGQPLGRQNVVKTFNVRELLTCLLSIVKTAEDSRILSSVPATCAFGCADDLSVIFVSCFQEEHGRRVQKIITPTVVREARKHFGCSSLNGAELENEGGPGIAGSHWESRIFQYEIMDGQAGNNMDFERHVVTRLTLAALEDTGWYKANWDAASTMLIGRDAGCQFLNQDCRNPTAAHKAGLSVSSLYGLLILCS